MLCVRCFLFLDFQIINQIKITIMMAEINQIKRFLGAKFGIGENIPDGIYAIPTNTSKGNAFMKYEIKNNNQHGENNYMLFWDENLTVSWYTSKKPMFLNESAFSKAFRKLDACR